LCYSARRPCPLSLTFSNFNSIKERKREHNKIGDRENYGKYFQLNIRRRFVPIVVVVVAVVYYYAPPGGWYNIMYTKGLCVCDTLQQVVSHVGIFKEWKML